MDISCSTLSRFLGPVDIPERIPTERRERFANIQKTTQALQATRWAPKEQNKWKPCRSNVNPCVFHVRQMVEQKLDPKPFSGLEHSSNPSLKQRMPRYTKATQSNQTQFPMAS
jgi:hypothetical protein